MMTKKEIYKKFKQEVSEYIKSYCFNFKEISFNDNLKDYDIYRASFKVGDRGFEIEYRSGLNTWSLVDLSMLYGAVKIRYSLSGLQLELL